MELKDTISMMTSDDYKERFKAEYWQTKIRQQKLLDICKKYREGTLLFVPLCSLEFLERQAFHMGQYLATLETRAGIEGIDLNI